MFRHETGLAQMKLEGSRMKILVCDDNNASVRKISELIRTHCQRKGNLSVIFESNNPKTVNLSEEYDLAFLDIDMPQMSGIELARKLHKVRPNIIIIFVTNFVQYAPDGYEVGAFRYLIKNQITEKLDLYFDLAVKEILKRRRIITIQINGEHIDIPVANILYMESKLRLVTMYLVGDSRNTYQFYGNLTELEQKLEILGFLRVHKSYIVNMEYIDIFQCKKLELKGGIRIPSSERKYSELKQRYLKWEAENKWSIY